MLLAVALAWRGGGMAARAGEADSVSGYRLATPPGPTEAAPPPSGPGTAGEAVLRLPPPDWAEAALAEHLPGAHQIDPARDFDGRLELRPRLTPVELQAQAESFEHSSLMQSGPHGRHSSSSQFGALGKDAALQLGDLALYDLIGRVLDGLDRSR